jgi:N6-adenosine-specific RNA methylase IME4/ParB-like chromosome segregation protein Spo0J
MIQKEIHELANLIPTMSDDEYRDLVKDIEANGLLEPITLYEGRILDGRHRYRACMEIGLLPEYEEYTGEDALQYVISKNLHRRHLTSSQLAVVSLNLLPYLEAQAKERQATSTGGSNPQLVEIVPQAEQGKAREQAAERTGTNARYVSDAKKIQQAAPELLQRVASGEMSIPQARREVKRQDVIRNLESVEAQEAKAIIGVYDVIVIDPPWNMQKIERDVAPEQVAFEYPTMTIEEIQQINIPAADDCHIFLWTTQKFLPDAFYLLKAWQYKYVCTFVWHKNGGFQPFGMPQYNCEFALYARKGTPEFIDFKSFFTCFNANRGKHSEKPEEFYELLRRVTAGRRLDMFNRRAIEGFDVWGKEA